MIRGTKTESEEKRMEQGTQPGGYALLEIRGMTKTFGPVTALDRVDLTVRAGEIRGLIG